MANNLTYENINWGWLTDYNGYKFAPITFVEQLYTEDGKSFNNLNTAKWNGLEDGSFVVKNAEKLVSIGNNNEFNAITTKSYEPIYFEKGIPHLCDLSIVRNIYGNINCSDYSIEDINSEDSFNAKKNSLYVLEDGTYSKATEYQQGTKYYSKDDTYKNIINSILANRENNQPNDVDLAHILKHNTIINGGEINGDEINGTTISGTTISGTTINGTTINGNTLYGTLGHSIHINGLSFNNTANVDVGVINSQYGGTGNATGRILIGQKNGTTPGESATSEGVETQALGNCSHAEGYQTIANGDFSHAEGYQTTANGSYSHAGGVGTIASRACQTAIGCYNIEDSDAIFIVGNGSAETPADALKVDAYSKLISNNNHIIRHSVDRAEFPEGSTSVGKALHFLGKTEHKGNAGEVLDNAQLRMGSIRNIITGSAHNEIPWGSIMYMSAYSSQSLGEGQSQPSAEIYVYATADGKCEAGVKSFGLNCEGTDTNHSSGNIVFMGAAWNDYAEFRDQIDTIEPGYCVASTDDGKVYKTTKKFQACDGIVSDTYGFAIGRSETYQTPLAVSGRVLAYYEGDRYDYHAGDTVCAGPEGKVCKMTRDEIKEYPDRIIGIVSEIPEYEEWNGKKVNNRIWIKVK